MNFCKKNSWLFLTVASCPKRNFYTHTIFQYFYTFSTFSALSQLMGHFLTLSQLLRHLIKLSQLLKHFFISASLCLICTKDSSKAFWCLQWRLNFLFVQEYWRNCANKMLVKLAPVLLIVYFFSHSHFKSDLFFSFPHPGDMKFLNFSFENQIRNPLMIDFAIWYVT